MKQEITMDMATEMVKQVLEAGGAEYDFQESRSENKHLYTPVGREGFQFGWLKSALAIAIVKGGLSREDLGIK